MIDIFEVLNSRFINIQIFDVGSSSSTSIVPSTIVMSTTVKLATVSIEAPFDNGDVSSDDSNCEDDSNMILGNFVSDKMKRKYMSSEWNDYIFRIGQFFTGGVIEFRDKLCKYAVENGFQFRYTKNDKSRISAECAKKKRESCQWYVHVSLRQSNNFFYITKLNNEHTCVCVVRHQKHKRLGSNVVSTIISDKVRANSLVKTRDIMDYLKQDFGFEVAYHTAYRGKYVANRSLHGDEGIGYGYLPWLSKKLPASYRDTLVSSFAACAYARTHEKFDEAMQKLRSDGKGVVEYFLKELKPENYAFAHFPGKRYGAMSNLQAKSYNNMIKDERCMPLPQLLEGVRVHTMDLFTRRRLDFSNWGSVLCPKMEKNLLKRLQTGRSWRVGQSSQDVFEVFTKTCNVMVNLARCECSCRHWEF
ncbi:hypothetical protein ACLB2K_013104 [Fragaria x ananassa]